MDSENQATLDQLLLLVYDELRRIANSQLRGERDYHTLQPTALVHELYSRMAIGQNPSFESRAHFLAVSARMMRKILIDSARAHKAVKRGGGAKPLTLDELRHPNPQDSRMLIELDQALAALQQWGELEARVIEMRYFWGKTLEEIAEASDLTLAAVRRHIRVAEAWLRREMGAPEITDGS